MEGLDQEFKLAIEETQELADLVASPNIEEMKGIIEDLANW